jgi:proteasome-associated ATPase
MDQDADLMRINGELAAARDHNERLITTLRDAREQIVSLKTEVDRLAQPPSGFATILVAYEYATADIMASGKKMRDQGFGSRAGGATQRVHEYCEYS